METRDFEQQLGRDGFQEISQRSMQPRPANESHTHDFTVRGLVTAGEFVVTTGDLSHRYVAGDVFEVAAGTPHTEAIGPEGATIITGRRR